MADFLSALIENPNRAKVLRALIFNDGRALTAADLGKRAGISSAIAQREIKVLERLGLARRDTVSIMLKSNPSRRVLAGKQKVPAWSFNTDFKHARALSRFVHEISPVPSEYIMHALKRSGKLSAVILSGAFVGDPSRPADLLVAADSLSERRLEEAVRTLEPQLGREIRYAAFSTPEFRYRLTVQDRLIRDTLDFPHLVLLDRIRLQ